MGKGLPVRVILDHAEDFSLELINNDAASLDTDINESDLNRPGLALAGFFENFAYDRVQVFGLGEWSYLNSMDSEKLNTCLDKFFQFDVRCMVFTHGNNPPEGFLERASKKKIPVLKTKKSTHNFLEKFSSFLDEKLAPSETIHAGLIEVFGVGILLKGKAGIGKSETMLELVERGHRLVADDAVEIKLVHGSRLYGYANETIGHHMEIRGLGIINIKDLFGSGSVRKFKRIDLVIHLVDWDKDQNRAIEADRLGLEDHKDYIMNNPVSALIIPIRPGRNIPILIETAAKNYNLKIMGHHPGKNFNEKLKQMLIQKSKEENA